MANGMDMLMSSLMKSAGFNPEVIQEKVQEFVGEIRAFTNSADQRITALEAAVNQLAATNAALASLLNDFLKGQENADGQPDREFDLHINGSGSDPH